MDPALEKVFEVPKALRASSVWTQYAVEKQERFIRVPFCKTGTVMANIVSKTAFLPLWREHATRVTCSLVRRTVFP